MNKNLLSRLAPFTLVAALLTQCMTTPAAEISPVITDETTSCATVTTVAG